MPKPRKPRDRQIPDKAQRSYTPYSSKLLNFGDLTGITILINLEDLRNVINHQKGSGP
jgi:hypothetical protein